MLRKLLCGLVFICLPRLVHGQDQRAVLSRLVASVQSAYDADSDSLGYYADKALPLAVKLGDIDAEIKVQRLRALKIYLAGKSDAAIKILLEVARDAEKHPVSLEYHEHQLLYLLCLL